MMFDPPFCLLVVSGGTGVGGLSLVGDRFVVIRGKQYLWRPVEGSAVVICFHVCGNRQDVPVTNVSACVTGCI